MKRKLLQFGLACFCLAGLASVSSCSPKEDEKNPNEGDNNNNNDDNNKPDIDTSKPTVTYHYNYEGAGDYLQENFTLNDRISEPAEPTREGYMFVGWYTSSDCTTEYDFKTLVKENKVDLYAKWIKSYVFEAEYTDFTGKAGFGYSGNLSGTDMISKDNGTAKASNGYFVTGLYYNGAFIELDITASEAIENVYLMARLSSEFYDVVLTNDTFSFLVNDEAVTDSYTIDLSGALSVSEGQNKREFTNHMISESVSLVKGENKIVLQVTNENGHGGTMYADAPIIDCIYLGTEETLSWEPKTSNLKNK